MSITLSIITVCFNNLEELITTCKSVDSQGYPPFEHIIINGSTTDDIKNWSQVEEQPYFRFYLHEQDNGISDAFNKGIAKASGEFLLMLNAGDKLADPSIIEKVSAEFAADNTLMWLHGMYKYKRANIWVTLGKPFETSKIYRGMRSICHQTMYVKKTLYNKYGLYNTNLKIGMDFDFLVRVRNEKFLFLPEVLAIFAPGGTSMQDQQKNIAENTTILKSYNLAGWQHKLWTIRLKILVFLLNCSFGKYLYALKVKLKMANI